MLRKRTSFTSSLSLGIFGLAAGAGFAVQACAAGTGNSGTSSMDLGGGGGTGTACEIATIANANVGAGACTKNSLGGSSFGSSCTGNGGQPEYWCSDFARWVWEAAGADVSGITPAAGSFYTYGEAHKTLHDTPAVGDAVVFNYAGGGVADHVAIVTQVNPDGTILSVSGDWNGESGSEAHFASTSHTFINEPAYLGKVGTMPGPIGMTLSAFVTPVGLAACTSGGKGGGGSSGAGGSAGKGVGGSAGKGGGGSAGGGGGGGSAGGGGGGAAGGGGGGAAGGGGGGGSGQGGGGSMGSGSGGSKGSGSGGSKGSGSGGSMGSAGYAFFEPKSIDRHHAFDLSGGAESISFAWHNSPGLAPPADLWVEADGRAVLQVAAVADRPFVRAGLDAVPLTVDATYTLRLSHDGDLFVIEVVGPSGGVLLRTQVSGVAADVVLPSPGAFRTAIESAALE